MIGDVFDFEDSINALASQLRQVAAIVDSSGSRTMPQRLACQTCRVWTSMAVNQP